MLQKSYNFLQRYKVMFGIKIIFSNVLKTNLSIKVVALDNPCSCVKFLCCVHIIKDINIGLIYSKHHKNIH